MSDFRFSVQPRQAHTQNTKCVMRLPQEGRITQGLADTWCMTALVSRSEDMNPGGQTAETSTLTTGTHPSLSRLIVRWCVGLGSLALWPHRQVPSVTHQHPMYRDIPKVGEKIHPLWECRRAIPLAESTKRSIYFAGGWMLSHPKEVRPFFLPAFEMMRYCTCEPPMGDSLQLLGTVWGVFS